MRFRVRMLSLSLPHTGTFSWVSNKISYIYICYHEPMRPKILPPCQSFVAKAPRFSFWSPEHVLLISSGSHYDCIVHNSRMASDSNSPSFTDIRPSTSTEAEAEAEPALTRARPRLSNASFGSRRRKVPDSVTPNACTNCKKARAKVIDNHPCCDVSSHVA